MNRSSSKSLRLGVAGFALLAAWQCGPASAQTPPPPPPPPAAPAEAPAAAPTSPLTAPSMAGPLTLQTTPYNFDAAGLGTIYFSGALSGLGLFQGGAAEDIQAEIMPHDPGQQFALAARAVFGMHGRAVCGRLDGRPGRNPQGIDAGLLVQDLRDVAAFLEHGHTQILVFDSRRAAPVETCH